MADSLNPLTNAPAGDAHRIFVVSYDTGKGQLLSFKDFDPAASTDAVEHLSTKQTEHRGNPAVEVTYLEGTLDGLKRTHGRYFLAPKRLAIPQSVVKRVGSSDMGR